MCKLYNVSTIPINTHVPSYRTQASFYYNAIMNFWHYFIDESALASIFSNFPLWGLLIVIALVIALLSKGADWLIDGAVDLALKTKLPKIVIGATILSLGTTAPEAFVSVMAAFMGTPGLALGNGVGSIIADTGLIFGLTVVIAAPPMDKWILNRTSNWQLGSAVLLVILALSTYILLPEGPVINRLMGLLLVSLLVIYLIITYRWARNGINTSSEVSEKSKLLPIILLEFLGGLVLVIIASRLLVPAAVETARRFGVPNDVIAATMVALGTSLPELSTAIAAIRKGHPEITVGNIVGADVLNTLFVIGMAALAVPLAVPSNFFLLHFPAMLLILISFRIFISIDTGGRFRRWQGAWLLSVYTSYIVLLYIIR